MGDVETREKMTHIIIYYHSLTSDVETREKMTHIIIDYHSLTSAPVASFIFCHIHTQSNTVIKNDILCVQ